MVVGSIVPEHGQSVLSSLARHIFTSDRSQGRNGIIGRIVRCSSHGDKDCKNVEPESEVGNPSVIPQGTDLRQEKSDYDEYQWTDNVADAVFGHLGNVLTKQDCDLAQKQEKGDCLEDIDDVASDCPPCSERQITVVARWKLVRVDSHEDPPDQIPTVNTDDSESCEDATAWTKTECSDREWDSKRAKDIGGDLDY